MSLLRRLSSHLRDRQELLKAYGEWVLSLTEEPHWSPGEEATRRIQWEDGYKARDELSAFDSPGLYLWGAREAPLYLGMTGSTFRKRFNRYVWGSRSQCKLAQRHEAELLEDGIDGFPDDVRKWYEKSFGSSTVRLRGAVAFARHGIDDIWFSLLPHDDVDQVKEVEAALIPVAAEWNEKRGHPTLLNVQHM